MMSFWQDTRVVVTGGAGFLGSFVVEQLRAKGCRQIIVPRSKDYDLVQMDAVKQLYSDARPDLVIHLAARVGGIGHSAGRAVGSPWRPGARSSAGAGRCDSRR